MTSAAITTQDATSARKAFDNLFKERRRVGVWGLASERTVFCFQPSARASCGAQGYVLREMSGL